MSLSKSNKMSLSESDEISLSESDEISLSEIENELLHARWIRIFKLGIMENFYMMSKNEIR